MSQMPKQWMYVIENTRGDALYAFTNPSAAADYMERSANRSMLRMTIVEVKTNG